MIHCRNKFNKFFKLQSQLRHKLSDGRRVTSGRFWAKMPTKVSVPTFRPRWRRPEPRCSARSATCRTENEAQKEVLVQRVSLLGLLASPACT